MRQRFATITNMGYGRLVIVDDDGTITEKSTPRAYPGAAIKWVSEHGDAPTVAATRHGGEPLFFAGAIGDMPREFAATFGAHFCETEGELQERVATALQRLRV